MPLQSILVRKSLDRAFEQVAAQGIGWRSPVRARVQEMEEEIDDLAYEPPRSGIGAEVRMSLDLFQPILERYGKAVGK